MSDWAFLRSGRWAGVIALAVAASTLCVFLGMWQWSRHEQRSAALAQVEAAWDAPPVSLDAVLPGGLTVTSGQEWQRVEMTGEFVPGTRIVVRNRPVDGQSATAVLGLFEAVRDDGGSVGFAVALGWQDVDAELPALPAGTQTITVRLRPEEAVSSTTPVPGNVATYHTAQILAAMESPPPEELPVLRGYGQLLDPPAPLAEFPKPDIQLGNNLSYAFQWWVFAAAIPVGVVVLARRERLDRTEGVVRRPSRTGRAEAEEDAILDAQEALTRE